MRKAFVLGYLLAAAACGDDDGTGGSGPVDPPLDDGTPLGLTSPDGSFYVVPVAIGNQVFLADIDTGSTTTAIAGQSCTSCKEINPLYKPSASATDTNKQAMTVYADGSHWEGEIFSDMVSLQKGTPNVPVSFAAIGTQREFFDPVNTYQGILGLGPSELLETGTTSLLDQLATTGMEKVLAFELCETEGTMWVGGFDTTKASEPVQYTPMIAIDADVNPFYTLELRDILLDGKSLGFVTNTPEYPIVDTGTTFTYMPKHVITALVAKINAHPDYAKVFTAPLSTVGEGCVVAAPGVTADRVDALLPKLGIKMPSGKGNDTFTLDIAATKSYLYDAGGGMFCLGIADDEGDGPLFGDTILRAFVSVIDIERKRIGFAPDAGCATRSRRPFSAIGRPMTEHGHPHRVR